MLLPKVANAVAVTESDVNVTTPDGTADCYFVHPASGTAPGVLVWPDAFGLRPAYHRMGKRLAESGYSVLVVNQYYRVKKAPVAASGTATPIAELMHFYQGYAARLEGKTGAAAHAVGAPLHDPCAVLAVTHPDLFERRRLHVVVETEGTHTRGMTLADSRPWADPADANTDVVAVADGPAAVAVVLDALCSY